MQDTGNSERLHQYSSEQKIKNKNTTTTIKKVKREAFELILHNFQS